ncbi:hypothetical protein D3C81_1835620 [compost metagenome]
MGTAIGSKTNINDTRGGTSLIEHIFYRIQQIQRITEVTQFSIFDIMVIRFHKDDVRFWRYSRAHFRPSVSRSDIHNVSTV